MVIERDGSGSIAVEGVGAGLLAHLAVNAALRKPFTSVWGLIAAFVLGVGLESYDIWMHYRDIGLLAPGNDPVVTILGRHTMDVLKIVAAPLPLVALGCVVARR